MNAVIMEVVRVYVEEGDVAKEYYYTREGSLLFSRTTSKFAEKPDA